MTHTRRARRSGASAIEFAIVLPVLLAILFGIIDWSLYMYERLNVGVVANRSLRLASGDDDPTGTARDSVCADLPSYSMSCSDGTVDATVTDQPSGSVLEVSIRMPFDPPVGLVPTPTTLSADVTTAWYGEATP